MKVFTYSEARQKLASLLDLAASEGEVRIKRKDGTEYVLRPVQRLRSPLDVVPVDFGVSAADIVAAVREGRDRRPPPTGDRAR